MQVDVLL